jgi:hypothetical protein
MRPFRLLLKFVPIVSSGVNALCISPRASLDACVYDQVRDALDAGHVCWGASHDLVLVRANCARHRRGVDDGQRSISMQSTQVDGAKLERPWRPSAMAADLTGPLAAECNCEWRHTGAVRASFGYMTSKNLGCTY